MKVRLKNQIILCLIIFVFGLPRTVLAGSPITLDGNFDDWIGQPCLSDPVDCGIYSRDDIINFSWATNDNQQKLYFMFERKNWGAPHSWLTASFRVYLDTNNNGNYTDKHDYYLDIDYFPASGSVYVYVYTRKGLLKSSYSGTWGQSSFMLGGNKLEFSVPMSDVGIIPPSQTIRMYAKSVASGDRVPNSGDIQWSPIPIMPNWLLAAIFVGGLTGAIIMIRKRRMVC